MRKDREDNIDKLRQDRNLSEITLSRVAVKYLGRSVQIRNIFKRFTLQDVVLDCMRGMRNKKQFQQ